MEFKGLTSASHMSLQEAGYGSEEGQLGFGDIRGSVGRYDPWGIKATGFAITRKINHYAAVTFHLHLDTHPRELGLVVGLRA